MSQPTIITLTLTPREEGNPTGTLLVQREELAHLRQFTDIQLEELTTLITEGLQALDEVEAHPPVVPEQQPPAPRRETKPAPKPEPTEPTIDIPLRKGTKAVKLSHLKITGGETDAAAYRQAVMIAGRLIDGKLWDGETPIRIPDVYPVVNKLKLLTDRELSLFTLADFVQSDPRAETEAATPILL